MPPPATFSVVSLPVAVVVVSAVSVSLPPVVSVSSMSKAYGLPGLRVGWAVCRDPELAEVLLAAKEQIVICGPTIDEAIAGLDRETEEMICARIREMVEREGLTVLAVTHGEAWRQMADRIYKIADCAILPVEPGMPAEVVPLSKANAPLSA